jgi:5'-nucleotidase
MKRIVLIVALLGLVATQVAAEPWFKRVLVTNDDGIDDPRLQVLARAFAEVAEVVVVAPMANCSGSTNYISGGKNRQIMAQPRDLGPNITAWAVDGFPGDCVLLALTGIMADNPPDLVVSGVNTGPNLADAYLASGTIGAARLAAQLGYPALAFSNLRTDDATMMEAVPRWCVALAVSRAAAELAPGQYLTVNFPNGPVSRVRGWCWAPPGEQVFNDEFLPAGQDAQGNSIWRYRYWFSDEAEQPEEGDVARHRDGWITVSPMRLGDLDETALQEARPLPGLEQR